MTRLVSALAAAAILAVVVPSLTAQPQTSSRRWEYLRLTNTAIANPWRMGYQACQATAAQWACRQFEPQEKRGLERSFDSEAALREAFVTLGVEGWELVSVLHARDWQNNAVYLFKRPQE